MDARHWRRSGRGRYVLAAVLGIVMFAVGFLPPPMPVAAQTWTTVSEGKCFGGLEAQYTVPNGTRYVQVVAIGGAGSGGSSYNSNNTGGAGGSGAKVTAILPVSSGQKLNVGVGRNGDPDDDHTGFPNGGYSDYRNGQGGGSSVVTTPSGDVCLGRGNPVAIDRTPILVLAGGGGGGGGANTFGSGGNGGNAGGNSDFSGQAGSAAYFSTLPTAATVAVAVAARRRPPVVRVPAPAAFAAHLADMPAAPSLGETVSRTPEDSEPEKHSLGAGGSGGGGWYGGWEWRQRYWHGRRRRRRGLQLRQSLRAYLKHQHRYEPSAVSHHYTASRSRRPRQR